MQTIKLFNMPMYRTHLTRTQLLMKYDLKIRLWGESIVIVLKYTHNIFGVETKTIAFAQLSRCSYFPDS